MVDKSWSMRALENRTILLSVYDERKKYEEYTDMALLQIIELENIRPRNIELLKKIKLRLSEVYHNAYPEPRFFELKYKELLENAEQAHGKQNIEAAKIMIAAAKYYQEINNGNSALNLYLQAGDAIITTIANYEKNQQIDAAIKLHLETREIIIEAAENYENMHEKKSSGDLHVKASHNNNKSRKKIRRKQPNRIGNKVI